MKRVLWATTILVCAGAAPQAQVTISPGSGSIVDADNHTWAITSSGSITKDGQYVDGGGGTAALTIVNGVVMGRDNGQDGNTVNPGGWFVFNGGDYWLPSAAPNSTQPPSVGATTGATRPEAITTTPTPRCGGGAATGGFHVINGRIIGPDGKDFIARGINAGPQDMGTLIASLDAVFPGTNFIRLATQYTWDQYDYTSFVAAMTAKGRVVEIEDHPYPSPRPYTGPQLDAEVAWYAKLAAQFRNNPYVWFGTMNEPGGDLSYQSAGPAISAQHLATHNAIRGAGNNTILMMDPFGGGNPGSLGNAGGLSPGAYAGMHNVAWDLHFYNWVAGNSQDQTALEAQLDTMAAQAQEIKSADGVIPVIVGEYGDSTSGASVDPGGAETVAAVISAGTRGKHGSAAWTWSGHGGPDALTQGLAATAPYGQMVQLFINTDIVPCSAAQNTANAQSSLTQITAQATAAQSDTAQPAEAAPPVSVDPASQAQIKTADAAIARANAIIGAAKAARP